MPAGTLCNAQTSGFATPVVPGACVTDAGGATRTCQPISSCLLQSVGGVLAPLRPPPPLPPPLPPSPPPPIFTKSGSSARIAAIDDYAATIVTSQSLNGALAVGGGTKAGWSYTVATGEARPTDLTADPAMSLFRWASCSKTVTGVVAAMLASEGVVDLDEDITTKYPAYSVPSTYLTCSDGSPVGARDSNTDNTDCRTQVSIPASRRVITLRQLLGHRAGIQHWDNGYLGTGSRITPSGDRSDPSVNTGMEWALSTWSSNPLVSIPGDHYSYSNGGPTQ